MQATLVFRFPRRESDVSVRVYVPLPEQRPRAAANFLFMCTGELPSGDVLRSLKLTSEDFATPTPAVLKPFADSAVVRIDRGALLEIGSSTTKSIFGGFYLDEPFAPAANSRSGLCSAMQQLRAGTVMLGGIGMANTNGSRYYILLRDTTTREELGAASQPLGFITSGLEALREACEGAAVHARTLAPLQPLRLWTAEVHCDCRATAQDTAAHTQGMGTGGKPTTTPLAGRVRRREESVEKKDDEGGEEGDGFFAFKRSFPAPRGNDDGGPQAKRRRAERIVTAADGTSSLRAMAVMNDESGNGDKPFDLFQAQETVFMDDIECIVERQAEKQQNRKRRIAKAKTARSASVNRKTKQSSGSTGAKKKTVRRRY